MVFSPGSLVLPDQQPTVGRIVHVVGGNSECFAALVTEVAGPMRVTVTTFAPRTMPYPQTGLPYAENGNPASWHWPERE